jgi:hypothetical protein
MDNCIGVERPQRLDHRGIIAQIRLHELRPVDDGIEVPLRQVVEHQHGVTLLDELFGDDAADVAGSTRDKDPHHAVVASS